MKTDTKPEAQELKTVHTASRQLYEALFKRLTKTNSLFTVYASWRPKGDTMLSAGSHVVIHPFASDNNRAFYNFAYKAETSAQKAGSTVNWSITLHRGSKAAQDLISLFNDTLIRLDVPEEGR